MQRDIKLGLVVGLVLLVLCGFFYMKMRATGTGPEQDTETVLGVFEDAKQDTPPPSVGPVLPGQVTKPPAEDLILDEPSPKEPMKSATPIAQPAAEEDTTNAVLVMPPATKADEDKAEDDVRIDVEKPAVPEVPDFPARQADKGDTFAAKDPFAGMGGEREYEVQSGDTLSDIASEELGSAKHWKKIFEANRDKLERPDKLVVGMKLIIPDITAQEEKPAPAAEPALVPPKAEEKADEMKDETQDGEVHIVKKGETLSDIAGEYLGSKNKWKVIAKANPDVDPNRIRPGQKIRIPRD